MQVYDVDGREARRAVVRFCEVTAVVISSLIVLAVFATGSSLGLQSSDDGVGHFAAASLYYAEPNPWTQDERFIPLTRFNALYMNVHREGPGRRLIFVDADVASWGPSVVSVNVIDEFTWAAASLEPRLKKCLLLLGSDDRTDPQLGEVFVGWLPADRPCIGKLATSSTARESDFPAS